MDVYINTETITEGLESIANTINSIENCVNFINNKVQTAGNDFTSINYFRASDNVKTAAQALNEMTRKIDIAKDFLKQLISHIEAYNGLKY